MSHQFGTNNLITNSTFSIVSGIEDSQHPLENIKIPITSKVFRSTGSSVEILIDTNTITDIDTFMMVGDNINGIGILTMSIYGSTTTDFSSSTEITIDISDEFNFGFKKFTSVAYRYWKVVLTGSTYCELSNIYLGEATEITTNAITMGTFKYGVKENLKIDQNKYGNKFITQYNSMKSLGGTINLLNTSEYTTLQEIYNDHKMSVPLWFITCPDDELGTNSKYQYSGYFYLGKDLEFTNTNPLLWSTNLNLIEIT